MLWSHSKRVCVLGLFLVVQCLGLPVRPNRAQVAMKQGAGGEIPGDLQEYMRYLEEMASDDPGMYPLIPLITVLHVCKPTVEPLKINVDQMSTKIKLKFYSTHTLHVVQCSMV